MNVRDSSQNSELILCHRLNLGEEYAIIWQLEKEGLSTIQISKQIAIGACNAYFVSQKEEFILSSSCVSNEINEHIVAYEYSIGIRLFPNKIALGFMIIRRSYNANTVYDATVITDIREVDVKPGDWKSQSTIFGYKYGIRSSYIGTERDPWANER